jgi:hypothetical protein
MYCVLAIENNAERYAGDSEVLAAEALKPGTVIARGLTAKHVREIATQRAFAARSIEGGYQFTLGQRERLVKWSRKPKT